ncbi:hypothetical protein V8D89_007589 [Ganoderma adspersum]
MLWTTIPVLTLVILYSPWRTCAEGTVLGVDVYGDTLFSFDFTLPITTASTAIAPDTTVTGGETVVLGSTHMHVIEAMTIGSETVTFLEDCPINVNNGRETPVCTIAELKKSTTISTVVPFTQAASGITVVPETASATPKNDAVQLGLARASTLVGVAVAVVLAGAIV